MIGWFIEEFGFDWQVIFRLHCDWLVQVQVVGCDCVSLVLELLERVATYIMYIVIFTQNT